MTENKQVFNNSLVKGSVTWQSPSNIALIKYWGKTGLQLPANPSFSFSLSKSLTRTSVNFSPKKDKGISIDLLVNGNENQKFKLRLTDFLYSMSCTFTFLEKYHLEVDTENSFPHSAGIASSASGMSALVLCICSIQQVLDGYSKKDANFFRKSSEISRIASGSASRSVYGGFSCWGKNDVFSDSSDEYAIPLDTNKYHPDFRKLSDSILVVDDSEKKVSSSAGHALMKGHPFAEARFKQAHLNLEILNKSMLTGDFDSFINIVETEALSLHALMMTSNPSYLLMNPSTIHIIEKIRFFRKQNKCDICFTLDAGPNIHLIYPERENEIVKQFIKEDLMNSGVVKSWIDDCMGDGPVDLTKAL